MWHPASMLFLLTEHSDHDHVLLILFLFCAVWLAAAHCDYCIVACPVIMRNTFSRWPVWDRFVHGHDTGFMSWLSHCPLFAHEHDTFIKSWLLSSTVCLWSWHWRYHDSSLSTVCPWAWHQHSIMTPIYTLNVTDDHCGYFILVHRCLNTFSPLNCVNCSVFIIQCFCPSLKNFANHTKLHAYLKLKRTTSWISKILWL